MKISIALATYNGEQFLHEQLASFARQTRLPDELVACDDRSTDSTLDILRQFAAAAPFPVRIQANERNLGVIVNFSTAIRLCGGDVIALADQDDVWYPHKLAAFERALVDHPDVGLVFGDGDLVDEQLRPLGQTMWQSMGLDTQAFADLSRPDAFERLLRRNYVTGAMAAFRTAYQHTFLPIPEGWVHDHWIALTISICSRLVAVQQPLIQYRQHRQNVIGATSRKPLLERALGALEIEAEAYEAVYRRLEHLKTRLDLIPGFRDHPDWPRLVDEHIEHAWVRARLPRSRPLRVWTVLREVQRGRYRRFAPNGNLSALRDLLAP